MKNHILAGIFFLFTLTGFAHQTEASSVVLVEKSKNVWLLQISASLAAFKQEVQANYSETPYETPEAFKEFLLQHISNTLKINSNGQVVLFQNGSVKLGHESKVTFEVTGIQEDLKELEISSMIFSDIFKSQSVLVVLKENFKKNQFILNDSNEFKIKLKSKNNELQEVKIEQAGFGFEDKIVILIIVVAFSILFYKIYRQRVSLAGVE